LVFAFLSDQHYYFNHRLHRFYLFLICEKSVVFKIFKIAKHYMLSATQNFNINLKEYMKTAKQIKTEGNYLK